MGNKPSEESKRNRSIDSDLSRDFEEESNYLKLLLLGTGQSGKSTMFKQIRQLYGEPFEEEELMMHGPTVYENILAGLIDLVQSAVSQGMEFSDEVLGAVKRLQAGYERDRDAYSGKLCADMKTVWRSPEFRSVWEIRNEFQALDSLEYFMANIDRIGVGTRKYKPTFEDWVHCRVSTNGIISSKFRLNNARFELVDVGGQRSQRKKWISCFDGVLSVLFVAAINEFDQKLFENHSVNRMEEAISVLQSIINLEVFQDTGFILFLNKMDLFREKVSNMGYRRLLNNLNTDYKGPDPKDVEDEEEREIAIRKCFSHVKARFLSVVAARVGRGSVTCHATTAVSSETMDNVFKRCQGLFLRDQLLF